MAEPWIRVHANIAEKRVSIRAAEQLGVSVNEAIGMLVRFWGAMSRLGHDGDVTALTDLELETWGGWLGRGRAKGRFAAFIREHHTDEEGRVNEWDEYQGALEDRRKKDRDRQKNRRDRMRRQREGHADSPPDAPQDRPRDIERGDSAISPDPSSNGATDVQDVKRIGADSFQSPYSNVEEEKSDVISASQLTENRPRDVREGSAPARANETKRDETSSSSPPPAVDENAIAARLNSDTDRAALAGVLRVAPEPVTWLAEMGASLDGMTGHVSLTPDQLGKALRDYVGNGASAAPSFKHFRGYLRNAAIEPAEIAPTERRPRNGKPKPQEYVYAPGTDPDEEIKWPK